MKRLLAILLLSCRVPAAMHVDTAFGDSERFEMHRAAEKWNTIVAEDHQITLNGHEWTVLRREPPGGWNGWCDRTEKLILIKPGLDAWWTYAVTLHEFGHALGLNHTSKGVMDTHVPTIEFSDEDMVECKRVGACQ